MYTRMSTKRIFPLAMILFLLAACAPKAPYYIPAATMAPFAPEAESGDIASDANAGITSNEDVTYAGINTNASTTMRMIIKNAEITMEVEYTDTAIDLTTQIISDAGGYIISSRVWYRTWGDNSFKYSTITIGVPAAEFERTLRRLRDIAMKVLDDNETGEDVTDQFVDLQAQLVNLEATRDRIRSFLDQAKTVQEALNVNKELSNIEAQIEQTKGKINYLSNRSAYSTITVSLEPHLGDLPTPTPTLTPTPSPTPTLVPWKPLESMGDAARTLRGTYRILGDIAIWMIIFILPVLAPFVLIWWLIRRYRKTKKVIKEAKK